MSKSTNSTKSSTSNINTVDAIMDLVEQLLEQACALSFAEHTAALASGNAERTRDAAYQAERVSAAILALTGGEGPEFIAPANQAAA